MASPRVEESQAAGQEAEVPAVDNSTAPAELLATQVMMPPVASSDLLATQVMASDLLATQVMAPMDSDLLATQVMRQMPADLLATQVMAPMDADLLATQVMRPVGAAAPRAPEAAPGAEAPAAERREVKRPKSAYWLFQEEMRSEVVANLGAGVGVTKVTAALAARWKELDEGAKAPFVERASELKAQYDKEIAEGAVPAASAKSKKAGKQAGGAAKQKTSRRRTLENLKRRAGPKKPKGSYSIWLTENRKEVARRLADEGAASPSFEEIARAAGKTWKAMTDEQKAPFVERARVLADKYKEINKACKEYKKANVKDARAKAAKKAAAKAKKAAASKKAKAKEAKANAKAAAAKEKKQAAEEKRAAKKAKKQQREEGSSSKAEEAVACSPKAVATPRKRASGAAGPTPTKAKKAAAQATAYLDMALVAEAEKAGFAGAFRKLAEREDMQKFPQQKLLDALVTSKGLLHPAKDALLAGTA